MHHQLHRYLERKKTHTHTLNRFTDIGPFLAGPIQQTTMQSEAAVFGRFVETADPIKLVKGACEEEYIKVS